MTPFGWRRSGWRGRLQRGCCGWGPGRWRRKGRRGRRVSASTGRGGGRRRSETGNPSGDGRRESVSRPKPPLIWSDAVNSTSEGGEPGRWSRLFGTTRPGAGEGGRGGGRRRVTLISAGCPGGQSRMTVLRREGPRSNRGSPATVTLGPAPRRRGESGRVTSSRKGLIATLTSPHPATPGAS